MAANVENLYKELNSVWVHKPINLNKCGQLLDQLKVCVQKYVKKLSNCVPLKVALTTKMCYLPTGCVSTNKSELILARNFLEIGVQYSVHTKDIPAFERYMSQLKCYYYDYKYVFILFLEDTNKDVLSQIRNRRILQYV